jgi:hypothetical protein
VVLRADTRVTDHGFRAGRATGHQSVLQAGTAVLVDDRGVPRVRCAGGNPLTPPVAMRGNPGTRGSPWPGYRPTEVIVVRPAAQAIANFTLVNAADNTWIERRTGHDVRHDRPVPPPAWAAGARATAPSPDTSEGGVAPGVTWSSPGEVPATPLLDGTGTAALGEAMGEPPDGSGAAPDTALPDGSAAMSGDPAADSVFGSPTDIFGN